MNASPRKRQLLDRLVACPLRWPEPTTSRNLNRPRIAGTQNRSGPCDGFHSKHQQDSLRWNEQALPLLARAAARYRNYLVRFEIWTESSNLTMLGLISLPIDDKSCSTQIASELWALRPQSHSRSKGCCQLSRPQSIYETPTASSVFPSHRITRTHNNNTSSHSSPPSPPTTYTRTSFPPPPSKEKINKSPATD